MIYDPSNAGGAAVYDVETKEQLREVLWVDTELGEVVRAEQPLRVTVGDEFATYTTRFATIYPIRGGGLRPVLFHCYGRQEPRPA
ncbi:hypothetical protein [Variovorax ginsengisoli]|uniref:Uncharacterized protein n=1 Tax=Variovorax ginsengisoli TaxID=363844 RepID=A0ABT8RZ61_9BURK|nr:hypothetical protein [Variovorax ginsengisoli]MDN8612786.1 hypothetical protein [Variovorax ginsengisoli]MDO1531956.1 hypothetical protein [Variovorax ginsengisoli]